MSRRTIGIILIVLGALLLVISLTADLLGIGGHPGLGWKQILGAVVGLLVLLGGAWIVRGNRIK